MNWILFDINQVGEVDEKLAERRTSESRELTSLRSVVRDEMSWSADPEDMVVAEPRESSLVRSDRGRANRNDTSC